MTSSSARPVSTTSPSSDSSYSPSETASCATETGIETRPVTDSAAFAYGSRSTSGRPSACWRARIESGSFLRVRRGIVRSLVELRFEDDPLARSFVARIPELREKHRALGLTDDESAATIEALVRARRAASPLRRRAGRLEVEWIEMIWDGKLSELGRLQFEDHGDGVLDVHIPETGCRSTRRLRCLLRAGARRLSRPSHRPVHLVAARPAARRRPAGERRTSSASSGASSCATRAAKRTTTCSASSSTRTSRTSTGSRRGRRSSARSSSTCAQAGPGGRRPG